MLTASYDSSFENRQFSPEEYRSAVLLARFRYVQEETSYIIRDVQKSDQSQEVPDIAIGEALKSEPDYR